MTRWMMVVAVMTLSGCMVLGTSTAQEDARKIATGPHGEPYSVNDLRRYFHEQTGLTLIEPDRIHQCHRAECRFEVLTEAYNRQFGRYLADTHHVDDTLYVRRVEAEQRCLSEPACRLNNDRIEVAHRLRQSYEVIITSTPGLEVQRDTFYRRLCSESASVQRNGGTKSWLMAHVDNRLGASLQLGTYYINAAEACWESAALGMDWREVLMGRREGY